MTSNQQKINQIIGSAAGASKEVVAKTEQAVTEKVNTQEMAERLVNQSLDKIVDDAVVKTINKHKGKTEEEAKAEIKNTIRGHKVSFFNGQKLIDAATKDANKQINYMIDKRVEEAVNKNIVTGALRPVDKALHNFDMKVNSKLTELIRFDIAKEIDNSIGGMLKGSMRDVKVDLNKLGMNNLSKELSSQVSGMQHKLASQISGGISQSVAIEQKKIADIQKQVVQVEKQIKQAEQLIKDKVQALQDQAKAYLKQAETKIVNEITKSIKLKF